MRMPGEDACKHVHANGMDVADLGQRAVSGCCQRAHALTEQCGWCLELHSLGERSPWIYGNVRCEPGDEDRS